MIHLCDGSLFSPYFQTYLSILLLDTGLPMFPHGQKYKPRPIEGLNSWKNYHSLASDVPGKRDGDESKKFSGSSCQVVIRGIGLRIKLCYVHPVPGFR